jgi:NADH-quinone oxidoreductase subunit G
MRVLAREHDEVDDGWLCDKGRFAYQAMHVDERITAPLVREGGSLREVSWERALEVAEGLGRHRGRVGALVGGQASNEEGFLIGRLMREGLGSADIDSRGGGAVPADLARALAAPGLQATVPDLEFAHTVLVLGCDPLDDAPIFDLRIRKGVRRHGVTLAIASARPTALDTNAGIVARYAPGELERFLIDLDAALSDDQSTPASRELAALAGQLRDGGKDIVIVWGEQIGDRAAAILARIADWLGLGDYPGAGLLQIPAGANGRGLREAGVVPDAGPGYAELADGAGRSGAEIAQAAADGEITALYLLQTDPVRDRPNRALWERAMHGAALVVAHASVLTEGLREHADVIFPAESHAEKDGTVVHPDGRLQRLRIAIAHPGEVKPGWAVLSEVARRAGADLEIERSEDAFAQLAAQVPFYEGLTHDALGGEGVRWPERPQARSASSGRQLSVGVRYRPATPSQEPANGTLRLGTYRPLWASPEVEISPALKYLVVQQTLELSPQDALRLGIEHGETVEVAQNGTRLTAAAAVRTGVPAGSAFLAEGIASASANELTEPLIEVHKA